MLRSSVRPTNATFCAMRSTILKIAISITDQSFAAAIFRSRFQLPAIVPHSRNASASSSKCNSGRNIPIGYENWLRLARICFLRTWIHSVANPFCTPLPARKRSRSDRATCKRGRGFGMPGKVYLVGAGPGDPELLTLKALRVLKAADVVLHDALIGAEILALVPHRAILENVGKRCGRKSALQQDINQSLINYARLDLQVVRLKGGDPLIFGRCGEEIEALRQGGIDFEIVPGITAALG